MKRVSEEGRERWEVWKRGKGDKPRMEEGE